MTLYVPTSSAPVAEKLTAALWGLTIPPQHRGANVTRNLFGTVTLNDSSVWLEVDTDMTVTVHPQADATAIAEILEPFVESGAITYLDLLELFDLIEVCRGKPINIWECFPQFWMSLAKNESELKTLKLWRE